MNIAYNMNRRLNKSRSRWNYLGRLTVEQPNICQNMTANARMPLQRTEMPFFATESVFSHNSAANGQNGRKRQIEAFSQLSRISEQLD